MSRGFAGYSPLECALVVAPMAEASRLTGEFPLS
jgi:hypothetical protein